jgi:hypothetical protein
VITAITNGRAELRARDAGSLLAGRLRAGRVPLEDVRPEDLDQSSITELSRSANGAPKRLSSTALVVTRLRRRMRNEFDLASVTGEIEPIRSFLSVGQAVAACSEGD